MTAPCAVEDCPHESPHATICHVCTQRVAADIREAAWLADQLDITLSRQSVTGGRVGGRSSEKPLPYNVGASDAARLLADTVGAWERAVGGDLLARLTVLASLPDAADAVDQIGHAVAQARRAVDSPAVRLVVGACGGTLVDGLPCARVLYAPATAAEITCPACGGVHDVRARRDWMVEAARDVTGTAAQVARLASGLLGRELRRNTITAWGRAGLVADAGVNEAGHPVYRLGDVVERWALTARAKETA